VSTELVTLATALWLGIVTSVSPCPLATNVAAISVLARRVGQRRRALAGAGAYTLGRMAVYLVLALILFGGLATMPKVAAFLRTEIGPLIGPILVLAGMAVLGWLPLPLNLRLGDGATARRISRRGLFGEFSLGALFALSFCPVSAALFFGSLIPLALPSAAPPLTVALYGLGTALPVGFIALLLVLSTEKAAKALGHLQTWQGRLTQGTAVVLLLVGVYLTVTQTILPALAR
jgi:cytochrome c-type biogenesis protein